MRLVPQSELIPDAGLVALERDTSYLLRDLAAADCPNTPGVYTLWHAAAFLYVGMARVDPTKTTNPQAHRASVVASTRTGALGSRASSPSECSCDS